MNIVKLHFSHALEIAIPSSCATAFPFVFKYIVSRVASLFALFWVQLLTRLDSRNESLDSASQDCVMKNGKTDEKIVTSAQTNPNLDGVLLGPDACLAKLFWGL